MKTSRTGGFTLIELMIVVAVIGILAAVAYPSYMEHIRKSRRADCQGVMLSYANALERSFSLNSTYPGALAGFTCPSDGSATTYNFNPAPAAGAAFTITAVPTGAQANDRCGTLTLSNTGARTAAENTCW